MHTSDEEPIPLKHIFGIEGYHTWPFPCDPIFEDYDAVMGFSTPQRLLREQMKEHDTSIDCDGTAGSISMASRDYTPV